MYTRTYAKNKQIRRSRLTCKLFAIQLMFMLFKLFVVKHANENFFKKSVTHKIVYDACRKTKIIQTPIASW